MQNFGADQRLTRRGILLAALQQRRRCGHRHHDQRESPEAELAQEDTDVDGTYASSGRAGLVAREQLGQ